MKRKVVYVVVFLLSLCLVTGCMKNNTSDALKFKKEYENLNGEKNSNNVDYREITIDEDNPFVYATGEDIVEKIKDKETFYVYFGSSYCPWCRSVLEKAVETAKEEDISKIYYVDIWDKDHVEILRDKYELTDEGKTKLVQEGGKGYQELLTYFDSLLSDYVLTDEDGKEISVGEKRIFAPNFIYVEKGKAIKLVEGISKKQKSSTDKLTEEILKDEEEQFEELFDN